jgi:hypothetical protein
LRYGGKFPKDGQNSKSTTIFKMESTMNQLTGNQEDRLQEQKSTDFISNPRDVWPVCGAGIGLVGCVIVPLLGVLLTVVAWVEGNSGYGPLLHKISNVSFVLTIPLLLFGGYCLDVLERRGWKLGYSRVSGFDLGK